MNSLTRHLETLSGWRNLTTSARETICRWIIEYFTTNSGDVDSIAALAKALAASGDIWSWPSDFQPVSDVPSTGGPTSLTTLVCPYILAGSGCFVPKLSVPGSIAGALDVLELIAGFNINLDWLQTRAALD